MNARITQLKKIKGSSTPVLSMIDDIMLLDVAALGIEALLKSILTMLSREPVLVVGARSGHEN